MDEKFYEQLYTDMNISNYASDEYLHINTCGISRYTYAGKNLAIRIYRPSGRYDYHLLLMVKGRKRVVVGGVSYYMMPGDCVFYLPEETQDYTFYVTERDTVTESYYIHFSGTAAEEITRKAHLTSSRYISRHSGETQKIFSELITSDHTGNTMDACGLLLRLLPLLSPGFSEFQNEGMKRIGPVVEYINTHFSEYIDINDCAEKCGLSRSRFSHLFSELIGMPPYSYQLKLRLDMAAELLRCSSLSVSEISANVGFSDPLYFSRIFRKSFSVSPTEFRENPNVENRGRLNKRRLKENEMKS